MKIVNKRAFSVIEYAALIVLILGAFMIMRNYIQRGMFGLWEQSGKSFAFGRQYDSRKTIECSFDEQSNLWYDRNCFDSMVNQDQCLGDINCEENIITNGSCKASSCTQLNYQASQ